MLRNFDAIINGLDKLPVTGENGEPVTLKSLAIGALLAIYKDEENLSGEKKFERYMLAVKINPGGKIDLKAEEIAELKRLIGKGYSVLAVGQAYELLDNDCLH